MRSIGVFGEPACKCACMRVCLCVCERYSPGGTKPWKGGLSILSIGTAPPKSPLDWRNEVYRQTQKQNLSGKEENKRKPSGPRHRASSHPLRTEVRSRNLRNLSGTKNRDQRKDEVCCSIQTKVQTPGQHFVHLPNITSRFQTNQIDFYHNKIRLLPKPTSGM